MKNHFIQFFLSTLLFISTVYLYSFQNPDALPISEIHSNYRTGLKNTLVSITEMNNLSKLIGDDKKSITDLRQSFIKARLQYKAIEFLAEQLDHNYVKSYINGAPLPSLEQKVPMPTRLDPAGFQILDELIFSEEILENKSEIQKLSSDLVIDFERFTKIQSNILFHDKTVFEASRNELIRIFTLGLTGFDTPLSGNAIKEAQISIEAISKSFSYYTDYFNSFEENLGLSIVKTSQEASQYLEENNDFDSFNRLYFYKKFLHPLDSLIQKAHLICGIETISEVTQNVQSTNYFSSDFFSTDFFNPYYFTRLNQKEDNSKVQDLGKILFFDPILSSNNERSCASCHNPKMAFTDGKAKSIASDFNGNVDRNAPTLINSVYSDRYFHDMRAINFETLLEHVITNRKEFSLSLIQLENKLKKSNEYVMLFKEAFSGSNLNSISSQSISAALTSYLKSINSFNSEFDLYIRGESAVLDKSVERGFNLFMGKAACGTCHFAPVFNGTVPPEYQESESEILGVPSANSKINAKLDSDEGRYNGIAKEKIDFYRYSFKTPTIRNIELTAPYMHNGVYNTLEEVMDFYNNGGGEGLGFEVPNQTLPFDQLNLNQNEQDDIIAFMKSLTDTIGLTEIPLSLPVFENNEDWNNRKIGGSY